MHQALKNGLCVSLSVALGAAIAGGCSSQSSSGQSGQGGASNGTAGTLGAAGTTPAAGASNGGSNNGSAGSSGSINGGAGTGAGGASAVGGQSGGAGNPGASGAGGAAPAKLCATKVTAASTQIADFENFDGATAVDKYAFAFGGAVNGMAGVYGGAYGYAGGTDVVSLAILAGHTGNYGLTESTMPATNWGQGLGFWMGCVNASAYKGVTFWVRGTVPSGVFSFSLNTENTTLPDSKNAAAGGTCPGTADTCKAPTKSDIPISVDWTQVSILWADLTGGLSGTTPVVANGDNITGFTLLMALTYTGSEDAGYTAVPGDISFAIDDIAFVP